jgi:hypothetical protein
MAQVIGRPEFETPVTQTPQENIRHFWICHFRGTRWAWWGASFPPLSTTFTSHKYPNWATACSILKTGHTSSHLTFAMGIIVVLLSQMKKQAQTSKWFFGGGGMGDSCSLKNEITILAAQEAESRRMTVQASPWQIVLETLCQKKPITKKGWLKW